MALLAILFIMITSLTVSVTGEKCGAVFKRNDGTIQSRAYVAGGYGVKKKCAWTIEVVDGSVIDLSVNPVSNFAWTTMALSCDSGRIEVYDVQADGSRYLKNSWCGNSAPHRYTSTTNKVVVEFVPTKSLRSVDFNVVWKTPVNTCQKFYTQDRGTILSSNISTKATSCRWNIKVEDNHVIDLRMSGKLRKWCDHSIRVYEVMSNGSRVEPNCWCQSNLSPLWISSTPEIEIEYQIPNQLEGNEISISWSKEEKSCHKSLNGPTGSITYTGGLNCKWYVSVPDQQLIGLSFDNTFQIDHGDEESCNSHNIQIYDVLGDGSMKRLGHWCGTKAPSPLKSMGSRVMVEFHSDHKHGAGSDENKFTLGWKTVSDDSCGGDFINAEGSLYSPNFPSTSRMSCEWTIDVGSGSFIKPVFPPYNTERRHANGHGECNYDQDNTEISLVQPNGESMLMPNLCWKDVNEEALYYAGSKIHIKFKSSHSDPQKFALSWHRSKQPPCGGIFEGVKGNMASPEYPSKYSSTLDCKWEMVVPLDQYITLDFQTFDLGTKDHSACHHDRIEIFDVMGDNSLVSRGIWCGSNKPTTVHSLGSRLVVRFVTDKDSGNDGNGFSAVWEAGDRCGGTFTPESDSGQLFTSNYPQRLAQSRSCEWTIDVGEDSILALKYNPSDTSFTSYACLSERVEVSDILPTGESNERVNWCSTTNPQEYLSAYSALDTVVSTTSKVKVHLHHGPSQTHSLSWYKIGPDDGYICQENNVCRFKGRTFYKCSCDFKPRNNSNRDSTSEGEIGIITILVIIAVFLCALLVHSSKQPPKQPEKYYC